MSKRALRTGAVGTAATGAVLSITGVGLSPALAATNVCPSGWPIKVHTYTYSATGDDYLYGNGEVGVDGKEYPTTDKLAKTIAGVDGLDGKLDGDICLKNWTPTLPPAPPDTTVQIKDDNPE